ncbi:GDSL-type esterase/lipase family protein [Nocardia jinanensis]|uniref:GDSL-type esterase/lipase family protein n=1 Tax=Nocardia jinanensis TaxID=382504 RepID=UPI000738B45A|nr:GDSL-type esterase/lipase family protein [Nocardia jinanensis]
MSGDQRICLVGDSFVAGVGDPQALGWAGRLTAHARTAGAARTVYNLGVRGHPSADIAARWSAECLVRLPAGSDGRVVFSFGVNDTVLVDGRCLVEAESSTANLSVLLSTARARGWEVLMVGPPPVDDAGHNRRIEELDRSFERICAEFEVPYAASFRLLADAPVWAEQVRAGDGAHPGSDGYAAFAARLLPAWRQWLGY